MDLQLAGAVKHWREKLIIVPTGGGARQEGDWENIIVSRRRKFWPPDRHAQSRIDGRVSTTPTYCDYIASHRRFLETTIHTV